MKLLNVIYSYKELIALTFVTINLIIKGFPVPLIIFVTMLLGILLFALKSYNNRPIRRNVFIKSYKMKLGTLDAEQIDSSIIDEIGFKEEIRVLKKVIAYAESCNEYYNYQDSEAKKFIDDRCKPFIDLIGPLLAVYPNEYQQVIQIRPSLEPYINEKIKEYNENRPALRDIESEVHRFNKEEINYDPNYTFTQCARLMIYMYGFSQEVLYVAKSLHPELYNSILLIYDQKLKKIEYYYDLAYERYKDPENAWRWLM